ncbi:phage integrase N-terminal domain-containing protein, partial [Acinetobacter guillouiae]|uniref:phage integrase N-terminal domain-containing protein n=1 Tax=Acinetobacter guillouiae TaxID=106649 RepID=UPI003AF481AB
MNLEYQFNQLCNKFREGSHATQANRRSMLKLFASQLAAIGYNVITMSPKDLKGRHVNKLIAQWRKDG